MNTTYTFDISFMELLYEAWMPVPDYEGLYEMSNRYQIRSLDRVVAGANGSTRNIKGKKLHFKKGATGYIEIYLWKNNVGKHFKVHRLYALFHPNPENKKEVNHKNGNKLHYYLWNTEWATPSENMQHACDTGLLKPQCHKGSRNPNSKLSPNSVVAIRMAWRSGKFTKTWLADAFKVHRSVMADVVNNVSWTEYIY